MNQPVLLKGNSLGLTMVLDPGMKFDQLIKAIEDKFVQAKDFFNGQTQIALKIEGRKLDAKELQNVLQIIAEKTTLTIAYVIEDDKIMETSFKDVLKKIQEREQKRSQSMVDERRKGSVVIDDSVLEAIAECNDLAPLHNPANLIGIRSCQRVMPGVPMVAVFDTAFHQTMPGKAYLYGLPYEYYEKYKVRRYGFHGTSHDFVSKRVGELLGKDRKDLKIIVCHLGNGASVSAVDHGKSVDTSMGLTPLEGLMMGTRSGDMDPAIVGFIAEKENLTAAEVINICNKNSGVLGLSGISSDFRDLVEAAAAGNDHAQTTLEAYAYRVGKYIGAYAAAMNGVDAIVFTAGIGENNAQVRALISQYTGFLGCEIDLEKNKAAVGVEAVISTPESKVTALVVPTNEELAIARETVRLVSA